LLSAGRAVSILGATSACGVSPVPLLPQESRTFRSSQRFVKKEPLQKQQSFSKEPLENSYFL